LKRRAKQWHNAIIPKIYRVGGPVAEVIAGITPAVLSSGTRAAFRPRG